MRWLSVWAAVAIWTMTIAPAPAHGAEPLPRERLAAERAALAAGFDADERACADRFAVNACVDEVRARRRAALAPLHEQTLRLEEAERRRRAAERLAAVARKQAELAMRPSEPMQTELRLREAAPVPPTAASAAAAGAEAPARRVAAPQAAAEQAAEAAARARKLEAASRRAEASERRVNERRQRQAELLARKGRQPDRLPRPPAGPVASAPER